MRVLERARQRWPVPVTIQLVSDVDETAGAIFNSQNKNRYDNNYTKVPIGFIIKVEMGIHAVSKSLRSAMLMVQHVPGITSTNDQLIV